MATTRKQDAANKKKPATAKKPSGNSKKKDQATKQKAPTDRNSQLEAQKQAASAEKQKAQAEQIALLKRQLKELQNVDRPTKKIKPSPPENSEPGQDSDESDDEVDDQYEDSVLPPKKPRQSYSFSVRDDDFFDDEGVENKGRHQKPRKLPRDLPIENDYALHVEATVQQKIWKHVKFLTDTKELREACELTMKESEYFHKFLEVKGRKTYYLDQFVLAYGETVKKKINSLRTESQSTMLKAYKKRYDEKGSCPTKSELRDVICRKGLQSPPELPPGKFEMFEELEPQRPQKPVLEDFVNGDDGSETEAEGEENNECPQEKLDAAMESFEEQNKQWKDDWKAWNVRKKAHEATRITNWEKQRPALVAKYEQNMDFFMWYWEELLPKVTGKFRWGHGIRYTGIISKHTHPDDPKTKYISASDEALVLLIYENCGQRFPYVAECHKNNVDVDQSDPKYQAKWSDSTQGQAKFGGWNFAGRERFGNIRRVLAKVRRLPHVKAVEEDALERLLIKNNKKKALGDVGTGKKGPDYVGRGDELAPFAADSEDEAGGEVGDELEEVDDTYLPVPKKKRNKGKKGGDGADDN